MWREDKGRISRFSGFVIIVIISSILGAVEGSALCYIFSNLNIVWLITTLIFGLLLIGSSAWAYYYIKSAPLTRYYDMFNSTSQDNNPDNNMLEVLKASKYPIERKINILKVIINEIGRSGKVTYEDVYHFLDSSYEEDEIREAFEFLAQPLNVIKKEEEGEYRLALSAYELKERLWFLSQVFLESSTKSVLATKPE